MSDTPHLTPIHNARGFKHLPPLPSRYGGQARAYESSLADEPHIWLAVECPVNLNEPDGEMMEAVWHGSAINARKLGEQLIELADNHYQIAPRTQP